MSVVDKKLYDFVKDHASHIYKKPSAYKSGYIVKTYKSLGGKYSNLPREPSRFNGLEGRVPMFNGGMGDKVPYDKPRNLERWFKENWQDVGDKKYPVYRPTVRINKDTPLLVSEIDKSNLLKQINLKQKIKGKSNLPAFKQSVRFN